MIKNLTREDFRMWGREGGLAGRKTPRRTCARCGSFVGRDGDCKRCKRHDANRHNALAEARCQASPPSGCSDDGRCPTCRQRNSHAGERTMDDGSVIVWHCNVLGCSNSEDHPNASRQVREERA